LFDQHQSEQDSPELTQAKFPERLEKIRSMHEPLEL
jgi:hypothetical protein